MKRARAGLLFVVVGVTLAAVRPTLAQGGLPRESPKASVTQTVGLTDIALTYGRPAVKGRTIWGGLVPWGEVWRTGANEATCQGTPRFPQLVDT